MFERSFFLSKIYLSMPIRSSHCLTALVSQLAIGLVDLNDDLEGWFGFDSRTKIRELREKFEGKSTEQRVDSFDRRNSGAMRTNGCSRIFIGIVISSEIITFNCFNLSN